jgi:hypothetical protein
LARKLGDEGRRWSAPVISLTARLLPVAPSFVGSFAGYRLVRPRRLTVTFLHNAITFSHEFFAINVKHARQPITILTESAGLHRAWLVRAADGGANGSSI